MADLDAHWYRSTACYHAVLELDAVAAIGLHGQCRAVCKFCPARCVCPCHSPSEIWPAGSERDDARHVEPRSHSAAPAGHT